MLRLHGRERRRRDGGVAALRALVERLAAAQQGVPAKRSDDAH
jgi:hypothetical protein